MSYQGPGPKGPADKPTSPTEPHYVTGTTTPPSKVTSTFGKDSLAGKLLNGAVAGVTGTLVIYPLDMIKTRLQSQRPNASGHLPYRSGLHCAQEILRKEGILGFYRGLGPNLVGITPEKAIKLGVNDYVRARFAARQGCSTDALPVASGLVAGAAAGFSQVIATNPMEIVKIRMQVAGATASSSSAPPLTAIQVVRQLGLRGLYKGTCATLLRDVPFSILFFPLQAHLKYLLRQPDGTTSFTGTFWGGIVSGAFAGAAVTPADVIKTRLQVTPPSKPYPGIWKCFRGIVTQEGYGALFKGAGWRAAIVSPLFAIAILCYEVQQALLSGPVIPPSSPDHRSKGSSH